MVDYDRFAAFPAQVHAIDSTVNYMSHYRGSPHFSHLDHPSSTPTTPSPPYPQYAQPLLSNMSPQTASQSRQPTSYPSPHSYPSPSMSSYAYPAPQQQQQQQHAQQAVEPYRGSPTASHVSLPSLNLPPIRSIDPRNPTVVQSPMGAPMGSPMGSYYAAAAAAAAAAAGGQAQSLPPPQQHMGITSSPHSQPLRYPLPAPPDGRIMSGGRHKKEIKRRTKTGCLTCRKRRIKCDEAHPTCRNCQKSKRECLGYDPIFKAQPGPAAIQPAPSSNQSLTPTLTTPTSTANSAVFPSISHGYNAAGTGGYAPALSAGASSPGSSVEPYDYSAAIDPALEAAGAAPLTAAMTAAPTSYGGTQGFRPDLKGTLEDGSPYGVTASETHNQTGGATPIPATMAHHPDPFPYETGMFPAPLAHMGFPAKRIKIDDLFSVGGTVPPSDEHGPGLTPELLDDIKTIYLSTYAPAIDQLLDTKWFATTRGLSSLLGDAHVCETFASFLDRARLAFPDEDEHSHQITQSLEMALVWSLMGLCRTAAAGGVVDERLGTNGTTTTEVSPEDLIEAVDRMNVVEALLSAGVFDANPTRIQEADAGPHATVKVRESLFWRLMGEFVVSSTEEARGQTAKGTDEMLQAVRSMLDSRENRDIIYSMAIVRHVSRQQGEGHDDAGQDVEEGDHNDDEHDRGNQLLVARTFIEREMDMAGNVVFQRVCGMAVKSWEVLSSKRS